MNTSLRTLIPMAAAAFALSACATAPAPAPAPAPATEAPAPAAPQSLAPATPAPSTTTTPSPATAGALPEDGVKAIAVALAAQPGTVVGLDDGLDDNGEWEVDILPDGANRAIEVKVRNGAVTGTQPDDDDDEILSVQGMTVPIEAAIAKAFTMMSGTFDNADLEMRNGVPTWEIDIDAPGVDDDQKVQINAVTGDASVVDD